MNDEQEEEKSTFVLQNVNDFGANFIGVENVNVNANLDGNHMQEEADNENRNPNVIRNAEDVGIDMPVRDDLKQDKASHKRKITRQ